MALAGALLLLPGLGCQRGESATVDSPSTESVVEAAVSEEPVEGEAEYFDIILRGGTIYDGSGQPPIGGDVGIRGERIAAIGDLDNAVGMTEVDVSGLAVTPGFINVLSWATTSLLEDGRSLSDIHQGVTLEVFGEGWSMGPLNEQMRREMLEDQAEIKYDVPWTTLSGYLEHLVDQGVSPNVASFVGATTIRVYVLGREDREPTEEELQQMRELVRKEMQAGALGVGSSLIYAPAFYAKTDELIELCKVASEYGGLYISHIRSEGNQLLEAVDELIEIAQAADIPAEIYHLKAAGQENWGKLDEVIAKVNAARAEGLEITADMYTYTAGSTGLNASMPPWVQEGGLNDWIDRLRDPAVRAGIITEMRTPTDAWENLLLAAGSPDNVLLVGFKNPALKQYTGMSLAQVAAIKGLSPEETAMDLVIEDQSRVETVYFLMDEANVRKKIALPWVSFVSDSASLAPSGVFLQNNPHPRAYGNFARLLGKYVREDRVIPLQEAVRRMTSLPADNLHIKNRGRLAVDHFADVVVFDPDSISDHATYEDPHQLASGVVHVWVNGQRVLKDGKHTGALPGQVVRGPGYQTNEDQSN
ncbi:unnamed protein product [Cladocopium goreaui]|uniref:D-aminoacylase (N-acyl-D-amino-acid deacylase) n=1 Tax=Cladocopium goreaui TaxID=2562237 RepID=A0A9P1BG91_9DINO|nr:unnamed protein product [Cladocopium goreaui]